MMDSSRRRKIVFRWTFVSFLFFTCFWTGWHLLRGNVTYLDLGINGSGFDTSDTIELPFWYDILAGPAWTFLIVLVFTSTWIEKLDAKLRTVVKNPEQAPKESLKFYVSAYGAITMAWGIISMPFNGWLGSVINWLFITSLVGLLFLALGMVLLVLLFSMLKYGPILYKHTVSFFTAKPIT